MSPMPSLFELSVPEPASNHRDIDSSRLRRRSRHGSASGRQRLGAVGRAVPYRQLVPGLEQARGHGYAHLPQPQERDLRHGCYPPLIRVTAAFSVSTLRCSACRSSSDIAGSRICTTPICPSTLGIESVTPYLGL